MHTVPESIEPVSSEPIEPVFSPIARLRAARALADLSQPELANLLGVSLPTIKRMEAGTRPLSVEDLLAISEACGVPSRFMLRGFGPDDLAPASPRDPADVVARLDAIDERMDYFEAASQRIEAALTRLLRARG